MSSQTFPVWLGQPGGKIENFAIDGSEVGGTPGSDGLDGRGKFLGRISKSSNTVTITWLQAWGDVPYVFFQNNTGQTDCVVDITTKTRETLVFNTVKASDGSPVTDADLQVTVFGYNTTNYVS